MDYLQEPFYAPPSSTLTPYTNAPPQDDPYDGMPPPPEGDFPSLPDLMRSVQDHARSHGYACVTASNNYKRGIAYVRCDRGGVYVNHWNLTEESRVRKNRTRRLVDCQWKARAKRTNSGSWVLTMMNSKHNGHGASTNANSHPSLRQLPTEAIDEVRDAFKNGLGPKDVLDLVKAKWNPDVTAQDVYNLKAKIARIDSGQVKKGSGAKRGANKETAAVTSNQDQDQDQDQPPMDPLLQQSSVAVATPNQAANRTEACTCTCCHH